MVLTDSGSTFAAGIPTFFHDRIIDIWGVTRTQFLYQITRNVLRILGLVAVRVVPV